MSLWKDIFLGCFLVGLLTMLGLFAMGAHHGHGGHGGHGHGHAHGHAQAHAPGAESVWGAFLSMLNLSALLGLLLCGGGAGFVGLELGWTPTSSLVVAIVAGLIGAFLVTWAIRLLQRAEAGVVAATDPTGTVARVIAAVRPGQIGEIAFSRGAERIAMPARSDGGNETLGRDAEVVIMRVENGTAYVRPSSELFSAPSTKGES